ncbi:MAG: type I restriction enzyme HsdR N-terminal domain-containing protein [Bacteroidales bacterium]|nr:type I restriction enzyme HsdR N-terminal domain-containing protein [Bacteroidales bacterium]
MDLNLPGYDVRVRESENGDKEIFDSFRRKYVKLTPEEWVRQHFLHFLSDEKEYPATLISVEKQLIILGRSKRFDAVVFKNDGTPSVLIEFKAPSVKLNQNVVEQVASYNFALHANFLIVSNGLSHYCCKMDYENRTYNLMSEIPFFKEL